MAQYALGIDVGYSKSRRSTGLCLLTVDGDVLRWQCLNTGTEEATRLNDLRDLVPKGTHLLGVGIDGPLTSSLRVVSHYRTSDALLSRGPFRFRGKPGQTSVERLHLTHVVPVKSSRSLAGGWTEGAWLYFATI